MVARAQGPRFPLREVGRPRGDVNQAGATKARIDTQLAAELAPDFQALHGQRQFAQVAMLLAAPTPVAAGLLAADPALLEQGDGEPLLRERIGRGAAGNAAADYHDVGRTRQLFITHDRLHRRRHRRVHDYFGLASPIRWPTVARISQKTREGKRDE